MFVGRYFKLSTSLLEALYEASGCRRYTAQADFAFWNLPFPQHGVPCIFVMVPRAAPPTRALPYLSIGVLRMHKLE